MVAEQTEAEVGDV